MLSESLRTTYGVINIARLINRSGAYPDQVSQSKGKCFLYHGASVMNTIQQGTHQFT